MDSSLLTKMKISYKGSEQYPLPSFLSNSIQLISGFFKSNSNNKLCLVFPCRELAAQWLSIPTVLLQIEKDYIQYKHEIAESHKQYISGDKLILNNQAIVEWVGLNSNGVTFKTKSWKESSGAQITVKFADVTKLQKAPPNRKALSSLQTVVQTLPLRNITPTEKLLNIDTYGNKEFAKNKTCLVGKYKAVEDILHNIAINSISLDNYFKPEKIDEKGAVSAESPLLISNSLSNLALHLTPSVTVSKIIIDGFTTIQERRTDFSDIDAKNIPTILITDLSEIDNFKTLGSYGFEFFNFTKEYLPIDDSTKVPLFQSFEKKIRNYLSFNVVKEVCQNEELENIAQKIYSIAKDELNNDLNFLKISLIQLTNLVSRITHFLAAEEISVFTSKINSIETYFLRCKMWLGDSHVPIEESILLLQSVIKKFSSNPSEKCKKLKELLSRAKYDYIICPTEDEAKALHNSISTSQHIQKPRVISIADVNDNLISSKPIKAILTGWGKSNNVNRLLFSFLFSELTVLFYRFEDIYYNSLQRRNKQYSDCIIATIDIKGIRHENSSVKPKGFADLYSGYEIMNTVSMSSFDILDYEFKLDSAQYSKYAAKENLIDSIKAKRIVFDNDFFIYATESHKFYLINEMIENKSDKANLHRTKVETLRIGDVIALINTDRDILVDLVENNTNTTELVSVKKWIDLWKSLLKNYYALIGNDFKKLVEDLRKFDCPKHEVTIKTWLQDDGRIGPDDNADLISIALLTNSNQLYDNITTVREAIKKMTGWRMKASDHIIEKIKANIHKVADSSIINKKIQIDGLGSVNFLKVVEVSSMWENINVKYANRLLQKETT